MRACTRTRPDPSLGPVSPSPPLPAALSFQSLLLAGLIFAPSTPVTHDFAGLQPLPTDFRSKLCLLLFGNLAAAWLVDGTAGWLYSKLKGRRICGVAVA